ncbi:unnamed protein product [Ectocarpus sp. 8 AP-2014]
MRTLFHVVGELPFLPAHHEGVWFVCGRQLTYFCAKRIRCWCVACSGWQTSRNAGSVRTKLLLYHAPGASATLECSRRSKKRDRVLAIMVRFLSVLHYSRVKNRKPKHRSRRGADTGEGDPPVWPRILPGGYAANAD